MQMSTEQLADDLLVGAKQIAAHLGWLLRRTQHYIAAGRLPVQRIGKLLTGRKSRLDRLFTADESEAA
jgi:hypothetical protein